MAVTTAGAVLGWGLNGAGQLGDGTTVSRLTPVAAMLPLGVRVSRIYGGGCHSLAMVVTVPPSSDFDGNGTADKAVYRPSTGQWFVRGGSPEVTQYGLADDIGLPLPNAIRRAFFP